MTFKACLLLPAFLIHIQACGPDRYPVWFRIQNNSGKSLFFTYNNKYPDTAVDNSIYIPAGSMRTPSVLIDPGQSYTMAASASLDKYFTTIPSDTFQLFLYDASVVKTTPWETVIAQHLVLKRYSLTLDSIRKLNGTIVYP